MHEDVERWLLIQENLGRARNTILAYRHALVDYVSFCSTNQIPICEATREHVSLYVRSMTDRFRQARSSVDILTSPVGLANATIRQRLTAVRLYYDYLIEEGIRSHNPVSRGRHTTTARAAMPGPTSRALVPSYSVLPWIPDEDEWRHILTIARTGSPRDRLMLALAYDAGLRREELCSIATGDLDPARRLVHVRAETTKGRRARVVPYSVPTGMLLEAYLHERRSLTRDRGSLFVSQSRRNRGVPITVWTWSKVIQGLARRAALPCLATHTFRHLCLTDLARAGWELHEIAEFAGHRNISTTLLYIHLSGRDLSAKLARATCAHGQRMIEIGAFLGARP
ncbi:tyrosine-type recombinase/integrase [Falsirhodobacter xinxiangensis]|uniref:tyrosine-type recombinase/integrase n=1 Tax=Falsirhodobacter xinxiangensis TaxID=2530049 RepID=UPI0010AA11F5|nr:tyrosine-type recombinase/integrase [Rhodobacter xinxiangensis]